MLDPGSVVTFDRVEGYRVVRILGAVRGEAVLPREKLRMALRFIGMLLGVTSIDYLTDIERARPECLSSLLRNAERLGANGILRVSFEALDMPDGSIRLRAAGEAVVLEENREGLV